MTTAVRAAAWSLDAMTLPVAFSAGTWLEPPFLGG